MSSSTEKLLNTIKGKNGGKSAPGDGNGEDRATPSKGRALLSRGSKAAVTIGVDISPKGLRLLKIARSERGNELLGYWDAPFPADLGPDAPGFPSFLSDQIKRFRGRDRTAQVWSLVSSAQAEMWHVRVPKVPRSKLSDAVYWTAMKEKPFDPATTLMDYEVQGEIMDKGVPKIQALVYCVPSEVVDKAKALFSAAGIKLSGLTISPIALQALFRSELVSGCDEVCANVYIGRNWSRIDLFSRGDLVLSRGVNTGVSSLVAEFTDACNELPGVLDAPTSRVAELAIDDTVFELELDDDEDAPAEAASPEIELDLDLDLPAGDEPSAPAKPAPVQPEPDAAHDDSPQALEYNFEIDSDDVLIIEPDAGGDTGAEAPESVEAPEACPDMTEDEARELLLAKLLGKPVPDGIPGADMDPKQVVELTSGAISRLVRQIERTFEHFMNTMGGESVHKIFFSGDICTNRHFLDVLSGQLGIECALLDPLGQLGNRPGAPEITEGEAARLGFNLVTGLALCDAADTPNLLHTYKDKDKARQLIYQGNIVYGVFLVLALLCTGLWLWQRGTEQALEAELHTAQSSLARLQPKLEESALLGMAGDAAKQQRLIKDLSRKYEGLAAIREVGNLTPDGVKLLSLSLDLGPRPAQKDENAAGKPGVAPTKVLVLDGVVQGAADMFDATLATYLARLQHSPLFEAPVVHKRDVETLPGDGEVLRFILHISLSEA